MAAHRTRRELLALTASAGSVLAGCLGEDSKTDADREAKSDERDGETPPDWRAEPLEDVTSGETVTIGDIDRPVLIHTFAIWCGTCQLQHREFAELTDRATDELVVVELNVDPDESPGSVREHADQHGFDWTFAVATEPTIRALVDEFGSQMASPPQSPVVLTCPDGESSVLDDETVVPANTLENAIEVHC